MPYRRRYYRRRRRYVRRGRKDSAPVMGTGPQMLGWAARNSSKALGMAKWVASVINPELKSFDVALPTAITTSWTITNLTNIAEGDDDTNRTGRSIKCASYNFRYSMIMPATASIAAQVRVVVLRDNWQQGSDPTALQVYESNTPNSLRQVQVQQGRFQVLLDRTHVLNPPGGGNSGIMIVQARKYMRHIKFIGTDGTDASQGAGNLYLFTISDQTGGASPVCQGQFRLRYYDN